MKCLVSIFARSFVLIFCTCFFAFPVGADDTLFDILRRTKSSDAIAANHLRVESQILLDSLQEFPADAIRAFILDAAQNPDGRVLAAEILESRMPQLAQSLDQILIDDPITDLRYYAIARAKEKADKLLDEEPEKSVNIYRALLFRANAFDQTLALVRDLSNVNEQKPLSEMGIDFNAPQNAGYLIEWEVSPPYDNPDGKGLDTVYPPEDPESAEDGIEWKPMVVEQADGKGDLAPFTDKKTNLSIYARAVLESPFARTISIRYSTQKTGKLWLNRKELGCFPNNDDGGDVPDKYAMTAELQPGRNILLVKNTRYTEAPPAPSGDATAAPPVRRAAPATPPSTVNPSRAEEPSETTANDRRGVTTRERSEGSAGPAAPNGLSFYTSRS